MTIITPPPPPTITSDWNVVSYNHNDDDDDYPGIMIDIHHNNDNNNNMNSHHLYMTNMIDGMGTEKYKKHPIEEEATNENESSSSSSGLNSKRYKSSSDPVCISSSNQSNEESINMTILLWNMLKQQQQHTLDIMNRHPCASQPPPLLSPKRNKKMVRFAPMVTMISIPNILTRHSDHRSSYDPNHTIKQQLWYGPNDYQLFELDCRHTILSSSYDNGSSTTTTTTTTDIPPEPMIVPLELSGCSSSNSCSSSSSHHTETTTLHGLEDFITMETKQRRTNRRMIHGYHIFMYQYIQKQQQQKQEQQQQVQYDHEYDPYYMFRRNADHNDPRNVLRQISEKFSFESKLLAIQRAENLLFDGH